MAPLGPREELTCCSTMEPPIGGTSWEVGAFADAQTGATKTPVIESPCITDPSCTHFPKSTNAKSSKKSAKRKAAEAFLERKASKQRMDPTDGSPLRSFVVNACDRACSSSDDTSAAIPWCSLKVTMPSLDWPAILTTIVSNSRNATEIPSQLPGGLAVHLVESYAALGPALGALRNSMQDGVIGIDLEWRPDFRPGSNNRVALMQLASGTTCVLIRCCRIGYELPAALLHLFSDPGLTFVAFSWDSCDQSKMVSTFGVGRECFARTGR